MPALAPALLIIVLLAAASSELSADRSTLLAASADPAGLVARPGATASPSATTPGSSSGEINIGNIGNDFANKQCIKPRGTYEVYRADKPGNKFFTENGKTKFNLYGKPCSGPPIDTFCPSGGACKEPIAKAFCSKENFCDAKMPGSTCYVDGRQGPCLLANTTATNAQYAAIKGGTVSDASGAALKLDTPKTVTAAVKSPAPPTAGDVSKAFSDPPTTAAPVSNTPAQPPAITQLITPPAGSNPATTRPATESAAAGQPLERPSIASNPALAQQQTIAPVTPGPSAAAQPSVNPAASLPTARFGSPTPVSSFRDTSATNPVGEQRPSFMQNMRSQLSPGSNSGGGNIAKLFSVDTLLSGLTSFLRVDNSADDSKPTIVQNVINVTTPTQTNVVAVVRQQNTARPTQTVPQISITNVDVPVMRVAQTYRAVDSSAINIGTAVDLVVPQNNSRSLDTALERFLRSYDATIAIEDIAPATSTTQIRPRIQADNRAAGLSSTTQNIFEVFNEDSITFATTSADTVYAPATSSRRSVSVIQASHIISLPELLDVISQRSMALLDRFLARGAPETSVIATYFDEPAIGQIRFDSPALLPDDARATKSQGSISGSVSNVRADTQFTQTVRQGSAWVAKSVSGENETAQSSVQADPSQVFGEIIPKMQKKGTLHIRVVRPSISETVEETVRATKNMLSKVMYWLQP